MHDCINEPQKVDEESGAIEGGYVVGNLGSGKSSKRKKVEKKHKKYLASTFIVMIKKKNLTVNEGSIKSASHVSGVRKEIIKSRKEVLSESNSTELVNSISKGQKNGNKKAKECGPVINHNIFDDDI